MRVKHLLTKDARLPIQPCRAKRFSAYEDGKRIGPAPRQACGEIYGRFVGLSSQPADHRLSGTAQRFAGRFERAMQLLVFGPRSERTRLIITEAGSSHLSS